MTKEQIQLIRRFSNPKAKLIILRHIMKSESQSVKNAEVLQSRKTKV